MAPPVTSVVEMVLPLCVYDDFSPSDCQGLKLVSSLLSIGSVMRQRMLVWRTYGIGSLHKWRLL